ncbi:alpha/beta hydrolase [Knoellia remsis]|nr:hypothetical protein [Knoellia remsis]
MTVLVMAGCGTSGSDPGGDSTDRDADAGASRTPSVTRSMPASVEERCKVPVKGEMVTVSAPGGTLSAGAIGDGTTGALLLHQTSGAGMCGWATYGAWLADKGVNVLMLDFCTHGQSQCEDALSKDWTAQVKAGVDALRKRGATSVTVVGASLGGVVALGVGQEAGADAIVDLSGPMEWPGVPDSTSAAKATTVPLLVSGAAADTGIDVAGLEAAVAASPATDKRFVPMPGQAHGWSGISDGMSVNPEFTPLATIVLKWVQGDYAG